MKKLILNFVILLGVSLQAQTLTSVVESSFKKNIISSSTPVLTNFNITNAEPSKVYFDASTDITGLTTTGIVVSGKTISSVTIDGDGLGGYFTVDTPFTFWDNNTIRLGEITDTSDRQSVLHNFTLEYIANNIVEPFPASPNILYVNNLATGLGDGSTEANAFTTLTAALSVVTYDSGSVIYVKATGTPYSSETANLNPSSGTLDNPNMIIGYKVTPGDLDGVNYYNYTITEGIDIGTINDVNPSDAPLFSNTDRDVFFRLFRMAYRGGWIIKNIQGTEMTYFIHGYGSSNNIVIDNCVGYNLGDASGNGNGSFVNYDAGSTAYGNNIRVINSTSVNASMTAVYIAAVYSLISNCNVYGNQAPDGLSDVGYSIDYGVGFFGSNNIIRNNLIYKDTPNGDGHSGHGVVFKGLLVDTTRIPVEHCLAENNEVIGMLGAYELRHTEVKYCVVKNNISRGDIVNVRTSLYGTGGVTLHDCIDCVVENNLFHDLGHGVWLTSNTEDVQVPSIQRNVIRNNIFYNLSYDFLWINNFSNVSKSYDYNIFKNNTINNSTALVFFDTGTGTDPLTLSNNLFVNNIINSVTNLNSTYTGSSPVTGFDYDYNNFYNGFAAIGTNTYTLNPNFVSATNFEPQEAGLIVAPTLWDVPYDKNLKERNATLTTIGAVSNTTE